MLKFKVCVPDWSLLQLLISSWVIVSTENLQWWK